MPFAIDYFYAQDSQPCTTDLDITAVNGESVSVNFHPGSELSIAGLWCNGAKHAWIGTLTLQGYTFSSDADTPLQFQVTPEGYVYLGGSGTVAEPGGGVVTLPMRSN